VIVAPIILFIVASASAAPVSHAAAPILAPNHRCVVASDCKQLGAMTGTQ
jgi:hypothetical protein